MASCITTREGMSGDEHISCYWETLHMQGKLLIEEFSVKIFGDDNWRKGVFGTTDMFAKIRCKFRVDQLPAGAPIEVGFAISPFTESAVTQRQLSDANLQQDTQYLRSSLLAKTSPISEVSSGKRCKKMKITVRLSELVKRVEAEKSSKNGVIGAPAGRDTTVFEGGRQDGHFVDIPLKLWLFVMDREKGCIISTPLLAQWNSQVYVLRDAAGMGEKVRFQHCRHNRLRIQYPHRIPEQDMLLLPPVSSKVSTSSADKDEPSSFSGDKKHTSAPGPVPRVRQYLENIVVVKTTSRRCFGKAGDQLTGENGAQCHLVFRLNSQKAKGDLGLVQCAVVVRTGDVWLAIYCLLTQPPHSALPPSCSRRWLCWDAKVACYFVLSKCAEDDQNVYSGALCRKLSCCEFRRETVA